MIAIRERWRINVGCNDFPCSPVRSVPSQSSALAGESRVDLFTFTVDVRQCVGAVGGSDCASRRWVWEMCGIVTARDHTQPWLD